MRNKIKMTKKSQRNHSHRYSIITERDFHIIKTFAKKDECQSFIMRGLENTYGNEREHYVSLLLQLNHGRRSLVY